VIAFLMPFDWNTKIYAFRLPSGVTFEPTASRRLHRVLAADADVRIHQIDQARQVIPSSISSGFCWSARPVPEFAMLNPGVVMNQPAAPLQAGNSTLMLFVAICVARPVRRLCGFAPPRAANRRGRTGAGCRRARSGHAGRASARRTCARRTCTR